MTTQTNTVTQIQNTNLWNSKIFLLATLVLWIVFLSHNQALAKKSYRMNKVSIVADLAADGSMDVTESRTYRFKGRFKYAYRTFPLNSGVDYESFLVSENNQPYELTDSKEPGTYTVTTNDEELEVRWYYRARRETRTFVLNYQVNDAVKRYQDGSVLYYKFIGDGFRRSTKIMDITVNPPQVVDQWKVRQWAHGPLWGSSETSSDGVVTAICENLPKKQFFELRILYPAELFDEAVLNSGYMVGEVTAEEEAWADTANLRREENLIKSEELEKRKSYGVWVLPMLVILAAGWLFKIVNQYGKRPSVPVVPSLSAEVPSDLPPAIVGYLVDERSVGPSSIMATLMDLARRGFLEFKEEHELDKGFLGREKWKTTHSWMLKKLHYREHGHDLVGYEDSLIKFVFEELADGETTGSALVMVDLETFKKQKSKVQKFFSSWSKEVKAEAEKHEFFDKNSFQGRNQGLKLGGGLFLLALPMIPLVHELALIPAVAGLMMLVGANGIVHHTRDGLILDKKWKALRKYLKKQKFKSSEPASVLEFIEPYFIYGVVLGMSQSQLEGLGSIIPADQGIYYMPWYLHGNSGDGFGGGSFGSSFGAAVAGVNSAMSSSTGAGGGASGGGGGGSGGGGGGAG